MKITSEWSKQERAAVTLAIAIKANEMANLRVTHSEARQFLFEIGEMLEFLVTMGPEFLESNRMNIMSSDIETEAERHLDNMAVRGLPY